MAAGSGQAVSQISQINIVVIIEMAIQTLGLSTQRRCATPREHPNTRHHPTTTTTIIIIIIIIGGGYHRRIRSRGLLNNQMSVGAADPKRGNRRSFHMIGIRPFSADSKDTYD
ncbi:hypothetical protein LAUMK15_04751 [Mycobacterium persicum]|nr:hypothetical protein LAUMK15_04751 [Mycobacterium persicum]